MTRDEITTHLDNRQALALTMWAEARGDAKDGSSVEERLAVGCVIRNRLAEPARWRAKVATYKAICLAPSQFSCWLPSDDRNHASLMALAERVVSGEPSNDPLFDETQALADAIISGAIIDRTGRADSYYAPAAMIPPGRVPVWAADKTTTAIGRQLFLRV